MTKRIVLVDDNPRDRRLFERGLAAAGFAVTAFATTEAAGLGGEEPDVLVTTDLPSLAPTIARWTDGAKVRVAGTPPPGVLVLLAADQRAGRAAALDAGADDALLKPVPVADLIVRIEAICKQRAREGLRRAPLARGNERSGNLAELGPSELLAILEEREQSGVLHLEEAGGEKGAVYLRKGKPIDAEVGKLFGVEALSRLAGWTRGTYRIEIKTIRRADRLSGSVDDALVAAAASAVHAASDELRPTEAPPAAAKRAKLPAAPVAPVAPPKARAKEPTPEKREEVPERRQAPDPSEAAKPADQESATIEDPPLAAEHEIILAVDGAEATGHDGELDALEARLRALELERARLPMASQGISDDNAEEYVALLPDLPPPALPPPAAKVSVAEAEETEVPKAASLLDSEEVGLDELASMFAQAGVGDLSAQGASDPRGGEAPPDEELGGSELEASIARQIQARAAAERQAEAAGDLAVLDNMTLPLGLAGVRGTSARRANPDHDGDVLGAAAGEAEDARQLGLDPDGSDSELSGTVSSRLGAAHTSDSSGASGGIDDESAVLASEPSVHSVAQPRKAKGVFDDLPGLTPLVAGADGETGEAAASAARAPGLTPVAPGADALVSAPLPAWAEGLGVQGAGGVESGAAPGDVAPEESEVLRALGIGGKRRILRFAALAFGVVGILGGVGIHHAMAKRKAGAIAASHGATRPASGTPGPVRVASRGLEEKEASAPTPEGRPRGGGTVSPAVADEPAADPTGVAPTRAETRPSAPPAAAVADEIQKPKVPEKTEVAEKVEKVEVADDAEEADEAPRPKATQVSKAPHAPVGSPGPERRSPAGPDEVEFVRSLATCRSRLDRGHAGQAARACREALAAHPDSPDALAVLAHAELNQKHLAQAITEARRAIALDPALAEPYLILGGALQDSGRSHEAGVAYRAYLARAPHGKYADELRVIVSTM